MKINKTLWYQAQLLDKEFRRKGERLNRDLLSEALKIPVIQARYLLFALNNIDVLQVKEDVLEFQNDLKALVINDLHIPYHDKAAVEAVLLYGEKEKVNLIILLGDIIDFYQISSFVKNPKKQPIDFEITETKKFLSDLRKRFPEARIIYKVGNHEYRLDRYIIKNAASIYNLIGDLLPTALGLKENNIEYYVDYFKIGFLYFLHGHEFMCSGDSEYVCNIAWKYIHDHFMIAHFHRTQDKIFPHISQDKKFSGNAVGWLGSPEACEDYAKLNKWNQGFAIIDFNTAGEFKVNNKKVLKGEVY